MSFHNLFFLHNIGFAIALFFLGSITASFLLCMGDRILQSKKFFTRSKCPQCNTKLPFYTLIPLLSYLFLLGKCHSCKKNIGLRYPLSEIIYGVFFILVWQKLGFVWASPFFLVCWSLLFFIAFLDWTVQWFYSSFLVLIFLVHSLYLFVYPEMAFYSFLGLTIGAGFLYFISFFYQSLFSREIGNGDISLLAKHFGLFFRSTVSTPYTPIWITRRSICSLGFLIKHKKNMPFPFASLL